MIPCLSTYTARPAASACGTATGRDRGSETAGRSAPRKVGQLTTGRLAVTDPAAVDEVPVPEPICPVADGADETDPLLTADALQPATRVRAASSTTTAGEHRSQAR